MINSIVSIGEYVIPFLVVLTVLVFFHELGHYLVARWNGVKVETFSIGFGPEIFGWTDKAETRWKISLIPLGGYVKMYGDADASSKVDTDKITQMTEAEHSQTLNGKRVPQKIAVVAAGPVANYLLAIVIMSGLFIYKGLPTLTNEVGTVRDGGVAHHLGIKAKDRIVEINGTAIGEFKDIPKLLPNLAGKEITIKLERPLAKAKESDTKKTESVIVHGKMMTIPASNEKNATPQPVSVLGITPGGREFVQVPLGQSVTKAIGLTYTLSVETLRSLGQMVIGQRSSQEVGGILSIGQMAKESASDGVPTLLWFMAILSINLGLINLLPVPVLDGGHILIYAIEGIRRKPVSLKAQEAAFTVGLFFVLGLMVLSTWNDLTRLKITTWIASFF